MAVHATGGYPQRFGEQVRYELDRGWTLTGIGTVGAVPFIIGVACLLTCALTSWGCCSLLSRGGSCCNVCCSCCCKLLDDAGSADTSAPMQATASASTSASVSTSASPPPAESLVP